MIFININILQIHQGGSYLTISGLYLILSLIEKCYIFESHTNLLPGIFVTNGLICTLVIWLGLLAGKQI